MKTIHSTPIVVDGKTYYIALQAGKTQYFMTAHDLNVHESGLISAQHIENWLGDNQKGDTLTTFADVVNGTYPMDLFRYEVMSYDTDFFTDKVLRREVVNANKGEYHNLNF